MKQKPKNLDELRGEIEREFNYKFPNEESAYRNKEGKYVWLFKPAVDVRDIISFLTQAITRTAEETEKRVGISGIGSLPREIALKDMRYKLFIYKDKMFKDVTWGVAYARGTYFCNAEDCSDKELGDTMLIDYSDYSLEDAINGVMNKLKEIKEQYKEMGYIY